MAIAIRERRPVKGEEIVVERPDGVRRYVQVFPEPLLDDAGNFAGAINLLVDITGAKEASIVQNRLAAIVESSDDAIVSKDLNGIIATWNKGAQKLFGYTAEEVIGKSITILMPPDRVNEEPGVLARIRRGESVDHYETIRRRKDGTLLDVSLTVSPIYDADGNIVGASKIARDITERKRVQQALAEADQRKDEFIAILAHELRNPLAPVRTSLDLASLRDFQLPAPTLQMMHRQVKHLSRLVEDLLDASRLRHGTIQLRTERVDLGEVIRDACEICGPLVASKSQRLERGEPDQPIHVKGDRIRLVQVLANLLNNAAKFTPPGGRIAVSLKRQGSDACVVVKDNGAGISQEKLNSIFQMFESEASTIGSRQEGLGIGLTLARRIVELHSGTLTASSDGLGKGAEFTICVPEMAEPASDSEQGPQISKKGLVGRRILVVDDNQDAADSTAELLRTLGHQAQAVYSGIAALEAVQATAPDIVLLDLGLPDLSGYDVAAKLRQVASGRSVKLYALTGWSQDEQRGRTKAAGFDGHLVKPVEIEALEAVLWL